jgi:hypothetical protein
MKPNSIFTLTSLLATLPALAGEPVPARPQDSARNADGPTPFPRLRSGQSLFQRPSPQKQIPSSLSDLKKFKNVVNMRSSTGCFILVVVVAASVDLGMIKQTFESASNRTADFRNPAGR